MKEVKTRDGSKTYWNEDFQEHYHSHTVGAIEEAVVKFATPCKLKDDMKILDVCFGLGYNTLAALKVTRKLTIVGLENDRGILDSISEMEVPLEFKEEYEIVKQAARDLEYDDGVTKIKILLGDARDKVKEAGDGFNAVFLDPFSPKKCPELWAKEFFDDIFAAMSKDGIIATYSCARLVRENLAAAGFDVQDGPVFGRKSPATIGIKK